MFSNKALRDMIVPLFIEQFLLMFVGIADTFLVSFSSEADVSGVSLVTSFNTVLIFLFTALASGGAVIISQYIGSSQKKNGVPDCRAASDDQHCPLCGNDGADCGVSPTPSETSVWKN